MTCPACGSRNVRTARICVVCGTILSDVKKTQFEYEVAELSAAPKPEPPKTRKLSTASLVLGLLSLTPATFITGIPAIITGAVAIKQRRPGRGMAFTGLITGAFGTMILTFAMFLPLAAAQREHARELTVKRNMKDFQAAFVGYSAEHDGRFPHDGVSWEPEDDDGMVLYFKNSNGLLTGIPTNPYTGERYHRGKDFFYEPEGLAETGLNAVTGRNDAASPFVGLAAPGGEPGTIVILGWSPPEGAGLPVEYAIIGYGRNTAEPLTGGSGRAFYVLRK